MTKVIFVSPDGEKTEIDANVGASLMSEALRCGIDGIVGECGGAAQCATCHVYVSGQPASELPTIGDTEDVMLDTTASPRQDNSRLSCQITVSPALEGLTLTVPPEQY
jgi:2Fe-2S ferredoxin